MFYFITTITFYHHLLIQSNTKHGIPTVNSVHPSNHGHYDTSSAVCAANSTVSSSLVQSGNNQKNKKVPNCSTTSGGKTREANARLNIAEN